MCHYLQIVELIVELGPEEQEDWTFGSLVYEEEKYSIGIPTVLYKELLPIAEGKEENLSRKEISEKIATIMAELIKSIEVNSLSGMILTGGDMAVHICRAIGVNSIKIISEIDSGVPLGYIESDNLEKLFIVTKAGAFGKPDVFIKSIRAIEEFGVKY